VGRGKAEECVLVLKTTKKGFGSKKCLKGFKGASGVSLTYLYNDLRVVIPVPYQVRGKLRRESRFREDWIPPCRVQDSLLKSGMTVV
jgi:hypothetical protein